MLRRALSNLLDNALRFTPPGGAIEVMLGPGSRICVANTGVAIEPASLPRLFDRFYRVDPARREGSSEHAGLGLAITRSIVQAHGASIRAECAQGWTRFLIEFSDSQ
ncbi:Sensor kinase CusS [compost metagenome]